MIGFDAETTKRIKELLKYISDNHDISDDFVDSLDSRRVLYLACKNRFIENLDYGQNTKHDFVFQKTGNIHVTELGLLFLNNQFV